MSYLFIIFSLSFHLQLNLPSVRSNDTPSLRRRDYFADEITSTTVREDCKSPAGKNTCCALVDSSKYDPRESSSKRLYIQSNRYYELLGKHYPNNNNNHQLNCSHFIHSNTSTDSSYKYPLTSITSNQNFNSNSISCFNSSHIYNNNEININISKLTCNLQKIYHPSEFETKNIKDAYYIQNNIRNLTQRKNYYIRTYFSKRAQSRAKIWLNRIKIRMTYNSGNSNNNDNNNFNENNNTTFSDLKYLSRFQNILTCNNHNSTSTSTSTSTEYTWNEWIEPITMHIRHPYFYRRNLSNIHSSNEIEYDYLRNLDFILLQSSSSQYNHTANFISPYLPTKHFLIDVGSSSWDSTSKWFTCGYLQRGIIFDQIINFEKIFLQPRYYWKQVPSKLLPYINFYNIGIQSNTSYFNALTNYIKEFVKPQDFLVLKLDIGQMDVEMKIALDILNNDELSELIDEFFFEIKFPCEFLGEFWNKKIRNELPESIYNFKLQRPKVMEFYQKLRYKGIRAHFWNKVVPNLIQLLLQICILRLSALYGYLSDYTVVSAICKTNVYISDS
eukprot:gene10244-21375_t